MTSELKLTLVLLSLQDWITLLKREFYATRLTIFGRVETLVNRHDDLPFAPAVELAEKNSLPTSQQ